MSVTNRDTGETRSLADTMFDDARASGGGGGDDSGGGDDGGGGSGGRVVDGAIHDSVDDDGIPHRRVGLQVLASSFFHAGESVSGEETVARTTFKTRQEEGPRGTDTKRNKSLLMNIKALKR